MTKQNLGGKYGKTYCTQQGFCVGVRTGRIETFEK